ncbi:MAG: FecR domain-containing protein [Candidatus Firestonebacteria bacterium]
MKRLIGLICVMMFVFFNTGIAEEIQKKAVVGYLKGTVKITRKAENNQVYAKLGMILLPGDKIETGADSKVELKLEDGSNFRIGDNSSVVIEEMKRENDTDKSTMKVIFGRVWMNIKKALDSNPKDSKIVTPKVTAAVKGTTYRADVDKDGEATVNVYDGAVVVAKDGKEEEVNKFEKVDSKDLLKSKFDEAEDAKDDWVKWNKNRDKIRIMVVFTEKVNGQLSMIPLSEVIFAEELLKNYLYSVVDQATLNQIRENEKLKAALTDDKDGKKAAAAGLEFGADIIITGQVDASALNTGAAYGMITGIADMRIKVVKCDTAEIVAAKQRQERQPDVIVQGAFNGAVRKASSKLVAEINDEIVKSWKKEALKGASINISLYNVAFEKLEAVRNAISGISGVKNVNQVSFVGGRALLTAAFSGDSLTLAEKAAEINLKDIKLNVVGISMNRIEIEIN